MDGESCDLTGTRAEPHKGSFRLINRIVFAGSYDLLSVCVSTDRVDRFRAASLWV